MAERGTLALTNVQEVEDKIDAYFESRVRRRFVPTGKVDGVMVYEAEEFMAPPTMAGLALALGVTRTTILFYSTGKGQRDDRLIPAIVRAKTRIAEWWEEALASREASSGAQFALRVNHGYGADDERGGGEGFTIATIPPAAGSAMRAIPKWEPEGGDDE